METNEIKSIKCKVSLRDYIEQINPKVKPFNIKELWFNFLEEPLKCFNHKNEEIEIVAIRGNLAMIWKKDTDVNHIEIESISNVTINVECVMIKALQEKNVKFVEQLKIFKDE